MFYVLYCQEEEIICENFNQVMDQIVTGWKLYGYSDNKRLAESLLHECTHH